MWVDEEALLQIANEDEKGSRMRRTALRRTLPLRVALLGALAAPIMMGPAWAAEDDGSFPTADQVGGEVFPPGLQPGDEFPEDVVLYDSDGNETSFGEVARGQRTLLTFFITAAPASIEELKKIERFAEDVEDLNVIFANSDVVGTALFGGSETQIPETVRTVNIVKNEENLATPVYVAPNNVFVPEGLSNRLGFRGLPTSYLIGEDGKVIRIFVGPHDWSPGDLETASVGNAATTAAATIENEGK